MKDARRIRENGVSLIETLLVIVIIAIIASLALMQRGTADEQFKRQNVARELKVALERARFDSVKRHAEGAGPATVVISSSSYTLTTDQNMDGTFQGAESVVKNLSGTGVVIDGYGGLSLPVTVTFDKRGEATITGGGNPVFYVCNVTCSGTHTTSNSNVVLVTPTGTVNLLAGNLTPPTFANANVTSVSTTTGISSTVSLP